MTTPINNFDDILNAMDADPRLAEALRDRILARELLQLPAVVQGLSNLVEALTETVQQFIEEQRAFNERVVQAIGELRIASEELKASNAELRISNEETKIANANAVRRMDRMEQDSRFLKNFSTETDARRYVESVADDMGLTYVRTLTTRELMDMAEGHLSGSVRRSFVRADLVMEVIEDDRPCYATVEVSYTVDARDTSRAIRNAGYITRFTGVTCYPGVVGARKDWESEALIDAGTVRWSEIEDWYAPVEE